MACHLVKTSLTMFGQAGQMMTGGPQTTIECGSPRAPSLPMRLARALLASYLHDRAKSTNINPKTLLATDYLNHFNELIMLIELVPSAPNEFIDEIAAWQPWSYIQHFANSGFADRDLAIAGYLFAPARFRAAFDDVIARMNAVAADAVRNVVETAHESDAGALELVCGSAVATMTDLVAEASWIINGTPEQVPIEEHSLLCSDQQAEVDALFDAA